MPPDDRAPLAALVWDVDGTLAETEEQGHRVAFNLAFAEAGLPWHWDRRTYARLLAITGGKERLRAWWDEVDPAAAGRAGADAVVRALHQRKTAHYLELLDRGGIGIRAGVVRLVEQARAGGVRLAIASTTTPDNVRRLLEAALAPGSSAWFEVIGAGDVVARKKPAPDIYRWVLERLALPPGHCMAIEDSAAGAAAATAAGLALVVTRSRLTAAEPIAGALADLDGLGAEGCLAHGRVFGRPWSGLVDLATLRRWHAQRAQTAPA